MRWIPSGQSCFSGSLWNAEKENGRVLGVHHWATAGQIHTVLSVKWRGPARWASETLRLKTCFAAMIQSIQHILKVLEYVFWACPHRIPCLQKAKSYYWGIINQRRRCRVHGILLVLSLLILILWDLIFMAFTFPFSLLSDKSMPFVFSEEMGQRLMSVFFALAQINVIVTGSHGRSCGPFCLPW